MYKRIETQFSIIVLKSHMLKIIRSFHVTNLTSNVNVYNRVFQ
jgi:hypothetical protein